MCPVLAGDGVLNGLRGEHRRAQNRRLVLCPDRRVEDKFLSMQLELKTVQVTFDVSSLHGNRSA